MIAIAYRVSQCREPRCRKYLTFPITTHEEWVHWTSGQFQHCGQNTEFVKIMGRAEYESLLNHPAGMESVCCEGDA